MVLRRIARTCWTLGVQNQWSNNACSSQSSSKTIAGSNFHCRLTALPQEGPSVPARRSRRRSRLILQSIIRRGPQKSQILPHEPVFSIVMYLLPSLSGTRQRIGPEKRRFARSKLLSGCGQQVNYGTDSEHILKYTELQVSHHGTIALFIPAAQRAS
jgi:hypothetical protein